MKKKLLFIALCALVLTAFNQDKNLFFSNAIVTVKKSIEPFEILYTPTVDNMYIGFKEALAFKESRGNYRKVNRLGYLGKYQFGESTLNRIRIYDTQT